MIQKWMIWKNNLLSGEALQVFEKQEKSNRNETKDNHKLVIDGLTSHCPPPKLLKQQYIYIWRGLFKPQDSNFSRLTCNMEKIVDYLKTSSPFGKNQGLTEDEFLDLANFTLLCEWQEQLLVQGCDSAGKSLYERDEFYNRHNMAKEIFNNRVDFSPDHKTQ